MELTALRCSFVQTATASQFTRHGRCDAHATPQPPRRRRSQRGWTAEQPNSRTAGQPSGHRCARPHLAGASATRCAGAAERSDGPNGCPAVRLFGCLDVRLSHPCWLRLRRGRCGVSMGVGAPMPRALTRRGCLNEAATQRSEFHGAPRSRPAAGLPLRNAKGSQTGGRLFFGDFLLAKQKKVTRTPGDSRPPPSTKTHHPISARNQTLQNR